MAKDWLLAPALDAFFDELNKKYPKRDKKSDGSIGNAEHAARQSDHNPDSDGMVHAIDVDVDGIPSAEIVAYLVAQAKSGADTRAWYIIHRGVIYSRTYRWVPRPYTGKNKHDQHFHISLRYVKSVEGNRAPWLALFGDADSRYTPWQKVEAGKRSVKLWDSGDDVKELQRILNDWYPEVNISEDGYFGPGTNEVVVDFQKRAGLETDGIVGKKSWTALNVL